MSFANNSVVSNLASSVTGNVNKACILLCDPDSAGYRQAFGQNKAAEGEAYPGNLERLAETLKSGLSAGGNRDMGYSSLFGINGELADTAAKSGYIPIRVQYNPESLSISGKGGLLREKGVESGSGSQYRQCNTPSEVSLSVELVFDDTDPVNAFPATSISAENVGRTAVRAAGRRIAGKDGGYSVQDISELFIAAIMDNITRQAGFVWNKMIFWGELTEASVQFTLFNQSGSPVRSKVSLHIRQEPKRETQGESYGEKYWENAFQSLFGAV